MLLPWRYEPLPALYLLASASWLLLTQSPLFWLAAAMLFVADAFSWMMRANDRRTDLVIF